MKNISLNIPDVLRSIEDDIEAAGGRGLLAGGAVIDAIQGTGLKDWDIEVYNISLQALELMLSKYGKAKLVGKAFGVIKLTADGINYDFSIPRRENKIGPGHKDFNIELVPNMSPREAAERRDLTINSMYIDLKNNEFIDPYNGLQDLEEGILRHTSSKFEEDPLRVLRIMQLLPRKGNTVAPETMELCRKLYTCFDTIVKESAFEEWNKLLTKANNPSIGLDFLVESNWIKGYPELYALIGTPQDPECHPEGDVWNHTKMVLDAAAALRKYIPEDWQSAFMYGMLLHDIGKPTSTLTDLTSYKHAEAGVPIAEEFMKRLTDKVDLIQKTLSIVKYHMRPAELIRNEAKDGAWERLHNAIPLNIIAYVSKADTAGKGNFNVDDPYEPCDKALELFEQYGQEKIPQVLMGRDLIAAGYAPGTIFKTMLNTAYGIQIDEGIKDKNVLLNRIKDTYLTEF